MYELRRTFLESQKGGTTVEQVHLQYLHTMPKNSYIYRLLMFKDYIDY